MQRKRMRRARRSAFTLLEILIVVSILALLAAFVVPALMRSGDTARVDVARSQVGRNSPLANGLKQYKLYAGAFPETDDGLEALYKRPSHIDDDSEKWRGPYMDGDPDELRDPWGNEFVYECPGKFNEDSYDLSSMGPDGKEDTDDDIKNWSER